MRKFIYILSLATIIALNSCIVPEQVRKDVICPVPEQKCQPGMWRPSNTELAVDTSAEYAKFANYYYKFIRVKNINTPNNEWGLGFIDNKIAALTFDDANSQKAMLVKFTNDDRALFQSGLGIPIDGSVGSISVRGKDVVFSAKESEFSIINKDKSNIKLDGQGKLLMKDAIYPSSDIYVGKIKNNLIYDVNNISRNITKDIFNWESQPAFSPDANVVFFSSDKPFFKRETEIWFMVKDSKGNWSEPINLGDSINTDCDELTPFISKDGNKLLFASSGHYTLGGYDIFESQISPKLWIDAKSGNLEKLKSESYFSKAKNLRTPLNTSSDELFPSSPENPDDLLYYSSNQADNSESIILRRGGFDIYVRKKFTKEKPRDFANPNRTDNIGDLGDAKVNPELSKDNPDFNINIPQDYTLRGTIFNEKTKLPVPNADLVIKDLITVLRTDNENNVIEEKRTDTIKTQANDKGDYKVKLTKDHDYDITAQAPDLFFETVKMNVDKYSLLTDTVMNIFVPEQLTMRINFPYDVYSSPYKYVLDSNAIETNRIWQDEIELLVKNIKQSEGRIKKLILTGHTDDIGSEEYNYTLGLNRVKFIVNQLKIRGIPSNLLEFKSKGKLEPLQMKDNEDMNTYRKRLRRVELQKVLI